MNQEIKVRVKVVRSLCTSGCKLEAMNREYVALIENRQLIPIDCAHCNKELGIFECVFCQRNVNVIEDAGGYIPVAILEFDEGLVLDGQVERHSSSAGQS